MSNIPSDKDFARAKQMMIEESRNLDIVVENTMHHFMPISPPHNVYLLPQQDVDFRAVAFFKTDSDVETCKDNGVIDQIAKFIREELEHVGRGKKEGTSVAFEFNSDENVDRKCDGDYFGRLRLSQTSDHGIGVVAPFAGEASPCSFG